FFLLGHLAIINSHGVLLNEYLISLFVLIIQKKSAESIANTREEKKRAHREWLRSNLNGF
ncbi:hypothetical protein, partial [Vibrio parahaemolyticus]|uniref:hypothetical protein n=1 Tax=Vibrio parahaemolyticus TaxID=670 RepID=UPI001C60F6EB